jgi:hypothetical protein
MIREIIYCSRNDVNFAIRGLEPPAVFNEHHCAISITSPKLTHVIYPKFVYPVAHFEFSDVSNESKIRDYYSQIVPFSDEMADRMVNFIDLVDYDRSNFLMFINCDTGISISAAIAKFVKSVKVSVPVRGLSSKSFDKANPLVGRLLAKAWGKRLAMEAARAHQR